MTAAKPNRGQAISPEMHDCRHGLTARRSLAGAFGRQMRVTADIDAPCCPFARNHHSNTRCNTMYVEAQITPNGSKAAIWAANTNMENASEIFSSCRAFNVNC